MKRPSNTVIAYSILAFGLALALLATSLSIQKTNRVIDERVADAIAGCERSNDVRAIIQDTNHTLAILVEISLQGSSRKDLTPEQQHAYDIFQKQLDKLQTPVETIDCQAAYGTS